MFFSRPKILGPRRHSAFDSFSKMGTRLTLRSEGAVPSTRATGESSGSDPKAAVLQSQLVGITLLHVSSRSKSGENTKSGKPFHLGGVINFASGGENKDIQLPNN
jgi:hypothetical protein